MKGKYNKEALTAIVEPLSAISSVFSGSTSKAHVIFEVEDDSMFVGVKRPDNSTYAMYEMFADKGIVEFQKILEEVGIWNVDQFTKVLGKFNTTLYEDDVNIDVVDNKLDISCGSEKCEIYLSSLHLFDESRSKTRRLKTEALSNACNFTLEGLDLRKILNNMSVFDKQENIVLSGKKGKEGVSVSLVSSSSSIYDKSDYTIEGVAIEEDFNLSFSKNDFKNLLSANDKFDVEVYAGKRNIVGVSYKKDLYNLKFYFSPLAK